MTEGFLTLERLLEYCGDWLSDRLAYNHLKKQKDAASILGQMLFDTATEVNLFFGSADNAGHLGTRMTAERKTEMVEELIEHLRNAGKDVRIALWAV